MQNTEELINKLKSELKNNLGALQHEGSFGRNLAIRTIGSSAAYIIGFLLSPIIARIYPPEAYGQFAVLNAMVAVLSIFATLNFINAFVLPKSINDFIPLAQLTFLITIIVSMLTFLGLIFLREEVSILFDLSELGSLIYFIPVMVFFTGVNRSLDYWNVRETEYRKGASAKLVSVIGAKALTIGIGILTKGNIIGFILGDTLFRPIHTYALLSRSIRQNLHLLSKISLPNIYRVAREYKNYPLYNMPANGLIVLTAQMPIYLLSLYFGANMTGQFSLAYSLTAAPIQILGMSVASVFYQKAVELQHKSPKSVKNITGKLLDKLVLFGVLPFGILVIFGDIIFIKVFGIKWRMAGEFAGYMGFMAFVNFISVSLNSLFRVVRKEKLQFYINLIGTLLLCVGMFFAIRYGSAYQLVIVFSLIISIMHLVAITVACHLVQLNPILQLVKLLGGISVVIGIMYLLRYTWFH